MAKWFQFIIIAVFCFTLQSRAQNSVAFSIQAHQDDWQLFMASRVMADLSTPNRKVVFITLTAGDQSCGACSYGNMQFFLARERGAMYSAKFAADLALGTAPTDLPAPTSTPAINGKNITKYVYKNTVNYFLRLPDGDLNGAGFPNNNSQSLNKLRLGTIPSISTVGVSPPHIPVPQPQAAYTSWNDLTNTIRAIINAERVPGTQSYIHTAHTNTTTNLNDHSDHYNSGHASAAAASTLSWVGINSFIDYHSSSMAPNLSTTDHATAAALFSLQVMSITEAEYQNDFNSGHVGWLPMDYFITTKTASGSAPNFFAGGGRGIDEGLEEINDGITGNDKAGISPALSEIPMIVSVTSPAFIDKDISILISPLEKGEVTSSIYDMAGSLVAELKTTAENRDPHLVTLKQAVKTKGVYMLKTTLNNTYFETRKIVIE